MGVPLATQEHLLVPGDHPSLEFERQEVDPAGRAAGHDLLVAGKHAAKRGRIAAECRDQRSGFRVPRLERMVTGGGDRPLPIRVYCHRRDVVGVAGERADLPPTGQVTYLSVSSSAAETACLPFGIAVIQVTLR